MSVFKVDKNFSMIIHPDAYRLVPELKSLDEKDMLYVILVADYIDGPFRKLPIEERKLLAKKKVYGDKAPYPEKTAKIRHAIEGYKGLVFDIRYETIDIYKSKIKKMHLETLSSDISVSRMKEVDASISFLEERIAKIEKDLNMEEEQAIMLRGNKELSFIEKWQRRQKDYKLFKDGA